MTDSVVLSPENQEIEIEFALVEGGRWYKTYVSVASYSAIMNTGMIESRAITAVKLWTATEETFGASSLVYDFILAKTGRPAWRVANG